MVRHARPDDDRGGRRLGQRLRREACGERPGFSVDFQTRLMRRIAPLPRRKVLPGCRSDCPGGSPLRPAGPGRSWRLPAVVGAALAMVVAWPALVRPPVAPPAAPPAGTAASQPPGDVPVVAIETLPTFAELEEGLRDGVRTLAASLVEVPDWASLADFDAAALLSGASEP